jgi:uncharacterized membrane protein
MLLLILGLVIFFAAHLVPTVPDLRAGLVQRFGEAAFKGVFGLVSLVGLVLIVLGYHKLQLMPGKNPILWDPPLWTRHVTMLLMIPALILIVAAYVPSHIRTAAKHPMLAGVKIWALAHLLANGDLGSLLVFGGFLGFGVYDRISLKRRGNLGRQDAPEGFLNDILVVAGGLALYAAFVLWGHGVLIGVPLVSFA